MARSVSWWELHELCRTIKLPIGTPNMFIAQFIPLAINTQIQMTSLGSSNVRSPWFNHHSPALSWVDQNSTTRKQLLDLLDSPLSLERPLHLPHSFDLLSGLHLRAVEADSQFRLQ